MRRIEEDERKKHKVRDLFPSNVNREQKLAILDRFLTKTFEKAQELSAKYDIPFFIIYNGKEKIEDAIEEFLKCHHILQKQNRRAT